MLRVAMQRIHPRSEVTWKNSSIKFGSSRLPENSQSSVPNPAASLEPSQDKVEPMTLPDTDNENSDEAMGDILASVEEERRTWNDLEDIV